MPGFMFEKISPPDHSVAKAVVINEPRGVIVQMLDRLTASRLVREARAMRKSRNDVGFAEADISPTRTRGT